MFINSYFPTVVWTEEKPEFVKSLNKASNKYIAEARKREKKRIKKLVILVHHIIQHHLHKTMIF